MRNYQPFIASLRKLIEEYPGKIENPWKKLAISSVNGLASKELRSLVSLEERRASGAFFTDTELGSSVLKSYNLSFGENVNFYDPACGASNLLISVKNHFSGKLSKKNISLEVFGTDIHKEFIEASKLRLEISDLLLNSRNSDYSKKILVADGLKSNTFYQNATHVITNPPFNQIDSPFDIDWASGKVSAAALFIDVISKNVNPGTEIIAILPDVLRSGSRYEKWRAHISNHCVVTGIKLFGQFDNYADVDVFSVFLKKKEQPCEETISPWITTTINESKLSDLFNVSVGTVVDNRDPHKGIKRPYLISKGLEGWTECNYTDLTRKHKGKAIQSPFVVIKRTSRFGDNHRAIATLVTIPEQVYVDNHLIVLQPKKGGIATCRRILKILKTKSIDDWIDSQIRCRHLTVKVVSNIPL
ncbi:N-6 DNA methylase [Lacibacter sp.]|uniref:N-6 DNA methylase n=1 Tax=Lacibacter sp. TaxID=1915409 RepID=UPI002B4AFFCC|nr:N-6 DNA methylase [Lacibacter sp.]HLP39548.1 N-6 DNA methylase [Lacibacter sp.]